MKKHSLPPWQHLQQGVKRTPEHFLICLQWKGAGDQGQPTCEVEVQGRNSVGKALKKSRDSVAACHSPRNSASMTTPPPQCHAQFDNTVPWRIHHSDGPPTTSYA